MSIPLEILQERIILAREYLRASVKFRDRDWLSQYDIYLRGGFSLAETMTLIHPEYYNHTSIKRRRSFSVEVGMSGIHCHSELIWGYKCDLLLNESLHADHLFPYAWGGPTDADNKIYLCRIHNQLKGSDIHLFPWEHGKPVWLDRVLRRINATVS